MEHSEEYYKMKYFKYKAKYTKEKQAQQSGGLLNFFLHVDAKNSAIKKAWQFYKKIKGADFNEDNELKEWKNMKEFDKLRDKIDDLVYKKDTYGKSEVKKYIEAEQTKKKLDKYFGDQFENDIMKEFGYAKSGLSQWCKNIINSNSIDKNCINDKLKEIVNKVDDKPVKKKK